eukprot:11121770-Alexandrium_andersonii.AAC.1
MMPVALRWEARSVPRSMYDATHLGEAEAPLGVLRHVGLDYLMVDRARARTKHDIPVVNGGLRTAFGLWTSRSGQSGRSSTRACCMLRVE